MNIDVTSKTVGSKTYTSNSCICFTVMLSAHVSADFDSVGNATDVVLLVDADESDTLSAKKSISRCTSAVRDTKLHLVIVF
jgi:hypothetical protein